MKTCSKCGDTKDDSQFSIGRNECKTCTRIRQRKWELEHREDEKIRLRLWNKNNKDREDKRKKQWAIDNPDKVSKSRKAWREANRDKQRELTRIWTINNLERSKYLIQRWAKLHPEKINEKNRNRCARKRNATGKITSKEWIELKNKYDNKCIFPNCERTDITMDHVIPLSLGGIHSIENIQPLCTHHNCQKGATYIDYRMRKIE